MIDRPDPGSPGRSDVADRLVRYADALVSMGVIHTPAVRAAFARVPRHEFVLTFHWHQGWVSRTAGTPPSPEALAAIYSNSALPTHPARDGQPASSSSAPSVMARILEAAALAPGMRVLEIGAGTGYNAALIAAITGAEVVGLEVNARVAAEAAASIARAGLAERVQIVPADGYLGRSHPSGWDRILVSCGIAGLSPNWVPQLAADGAILAPVAFAGVHPIIRATRAEGEITGRVACWADFMHAAGPLCPSPLRDHAPAGAIPVAGVEVSELRVPAMSTLQYQDLHCHLGGTDPRTTRAYCDEHPFDPARGQLALHTPTATAWVQTDGAILTAGPHTAAQPLARHLHRMVLAWHDAQRPTARDWTTRFTPATQLDPPLLLPGDWRRDPRR